MKKLILIFIALSFVSVCIAIQDKHKAVIARKNVVVGGGLLVDETFDSAGYDLGGWSESIVDGTIDEDYTGVILSGTQSLQMITTDASGALTTTISYTANDEIWAKMMFIKKTDADHYNDVIRILDASDNTLLRIRAASDGHFQLKDSDVSADCGAYSYNQTYYFWIRYKKGTGNDSEHDFYYATTDSQPGSPDCSSSSGTATAQAAKIQLKNDLQTTHKDWVFDDVQLDDSAWGSW